MFKSAATLVTAGSLAAGEGAKKVQENSPKYTILFQNKQKKSNK